MAYGNCNSPGVAILKDSFQGKILKNIAHNSYIYVNVYIYTYINYIKKPLILGEIFQFEAVRV